MIISAYFVSNKKQWCQKKKNSAKSVCARKREREDCIQKGEWILEELSSMEAQGGVPFANPFFFWFLHPDEKDSNGQAYVGQLLFLPKPWLDRLLGGPKSFSIKHIFWHPVIAAALVLNSTAGPAPPCSPFLAKPLLPRRHAWSVCW